MKEPADEFQLDWNKNKTCLYKDIILQNVDM